MMVIASTAINFEPLGEQDEQLRTPPAVVEIWGAGYTGAKQPRRLKPFPASHAFPTPKKVRLCINIKLSFSTYFFKL
jgi:hypothetical protein